MKIYHVDHVILSEIFYQQIGSGTKRTVEKFYDDAGNMTKITHPNGRDVEYTYTGIYQPDLVKTEVTGDATIDTVADYDYQYNSTGDGEPPAVPPIFWTGS